MTLTMHAHLGLFVILRLVHTKFEINLKTRFTRSNYVIGPQNLKNGPQDLAVPIWGSVPSQANTWPIHVYKGL